MNVLLLFLLTAAPPKPVCNAASQGRFWPEAANSSGETARKLYQCGALEMCSATPWSYKWKPLSLNVGQTGKKRHPDAQACLLQQAAENRSR